jgi:polar amino acid transport system substrate-binding protein
MIALLRALPRYLVIPPLAVPALSLTLTLTLTLTLSAIASATATAAESGNTTLRFVQKIEDAPGNSSPVRPSGFQDGLGNALAKQLRMKLVFIGLPRKRMMSALESGDGDIVCGYLPAWFPGDVVWSRTFIPTSEVLIASKRVPAPTSVEALRGKLVGTVLGFQYPDIEQKLGADFLRDDAPSLNLTVRKWQAGRFDYFVTTGQSIDKQFPNGELSAGYNLLVVSEVKSGCAVSRKGHVSVAKINAALDALEKNGEMRRLLRLR